MTKVYEIIHYEEDGMDIFQEWLDALRDMQAQTAIRRAVDRMEGGNFGDNKPCRNGKGVYY